MTGGGEHHIGSQARPKKNCLLTESLFNVCQIMKTQNENLAPCVVKIDTFSEDLKVTETIVTAKNPAFQNCL
jgi:hypothetical protein